MTPGLFVVRRQKGLKQHVGVFWAGAVLATAEQFANPRPVGVFVDLGPDGLKVESRPDMGEWAIERAIDTPGAAERLNQVVQQKPTYNVLQSNCEHLVSYVETGAAASPQLQGFMWLLGLSLGIGLLAKKA